jgi:hypothetical protein
MGAALDHPALGGIGELAVTADLLGLALGSVHGSIAA